MLYANFGSAFLDKRAAAKQELLARFATMTSKQREDFWMTFPALTVAQERALSQDAQATRAGQQDAIAEMIWDPLGNVGPNRNAFTMSPPYDWKGVPASPGVAARAGEDFGSRFTDSSWDANTLTATFHAAGLTSSDFWAAYDFVHAYYAMKELYHTACTRSGRLVCAGSKAVAAVPGVGQIQNYGTKILDYLEKKNLSEEEYKAAARGYIKAQDDYAMWQRYICDCTWANRAEDTKALAAAYGFNDLNNALGLLLHLGIRKDKKGGKAIPVPIAFNPPSRLIKTAGTLSTKYPSGSVARFNKTRGTWTIYIPDPALHGPFMGATPGVFPVPPGGFLRAGEELTKPSNVADAGTEVDRRWYHSPLPWIGAAGAVVATGVTVRKLRQRRGR